MRRVQIVHQQYNSPMGLYSEEAVAETLSKHARLLVNGAVGVDFNQLQVPHLARSEVFKMLQDESDVQPHDQHSQQQQRQQQQQQQQQQIEQMPGESEMRLFQCQLQVEQELELRRQQQLQLSLDHKNQQELQRQRELAVARQQQLMEEELLRKTPSPEERRKAQKGQAGRVSEAEVKSDVEEEDLRMYQQLQEEEEELKRVKIEEELQKQQRWEEEQKEKSLRQEQELRRQREVEEEKLRLYHQLQEQEEELKKLKIEEGLMKQMQWEEEQKEKLLKQEHELRKQREAEEEKLRLYQQQLYEEENLKRLKQQQEWEEQQKKMETERLARQTEEEKAIQLQRQQEIQRQRQIEEEAVRRKNLAGAKEAQLQRQKETPAPTAEEAPPKKKMDDAIRKLASSHWGEPLQIRWPPPAPQRPRPRVAFAVRSSSAGASGVKRVAWPPSTASVVHAAPRRPTDEPPPPPTSRPTSLKFRPSRRDTEPLRPSPAFHSSQSQDNYETTDGDTDDMVSENREVAAAFASNELIGERQLVAKPPPPAGLTLNPLRKTAPFTQPPAAVATSNPFVKKAPVRMLGNMVWPPKKDDSMQPAQPTQVPASPKMSRRDYRGFFAQNQLPASFPTYRAPPGTQHFGLVEGQNDSAM